MRRPNTRRCLVCDDVISRKHVRRSIFMCTSDMDDVDRGLSERLEVILDTTLDERVCHSTELCHLCEAQLVQIEEYFRLLLLFRETFKKTSKKYSNLCHTSTKARGKKERKTRKASLEDTTTSTATKHSQLKGHTSLQEVSTERNAQLAVAVDDAPFSHTEGDKTFTEDGANASVKLCGQHNQDVAPKDKSGKKERTCRKSKGSKSDSETSQKAETVDGPVVPQTEAVFLRENSGSPMKSGASEADKSLKVSNQNHTKENSDTEQQKQLSMKRFAGKRKYKCIVCTKVFATMRNLKRHQEGHTANHKTAKYECPACNAKFTRSNSLYAHLKIHEADGTEVFSCSQCSQVFLIKDELVQHSKEKCGHKKKHKCPQCELSFRCKSELASHELIHVGMRPFLCTVCGKSFSRKNNLTEHSRLHSGKKPYKCDVCSVSFAFRSGLALHNRKHHDGRKGHHCIHCNKSFALVGNLQVHMRLHTGEKPFLCPECGRGFSQSSTLHMHLATHSQERPFKCASCDKAFKRADILQRHTLTHTGENPYQCSTCGNSYRDRRSLNRHRLSHSTTTPHSCLTCGKTFKHKYNLHDHEQVHTGERSHRCQVCNKAFALPRYLKKHLLLHEKGTNQTRAKKKPKEDSHKGEDLREPREDSHIVTVDEVDGNPFAPVDGAKSPEVDERRFSEPPEGPKLTHVAVHANDRDPRMIAMHEERTPGELLPVMEESQRAPLDLHPQEPSASEQHFHPHTMNEPPSFAGFKTLHNAFPSGIPAKPQCLTLCPTAVPSPQDREPPAPDLSYQSAVEGSAVTENRIVCYHQSASLAAPQVAPLPHMSEAFNETLNLKMVKYSDYRHPREMCAESLDSFSSVHETHTYVSAFTTTHSEDHSPSGPLPFPYHGSSQPQFLPPRLINVEQALTGGPYPTRPHSLEETSAGQIPMSQVTSQFAGMGEKLVLTKWKD